MRKIYTFLVALLTLCGVVQAQTTYLKILSEDDLVAGSTYLMVNEDAKVALGAISSTTTPYGTTVSVTISDGSITINDEAVDVLTLGGTAGEWTLASSLANGYIAWTSGNSLRLQTEVNEKAQWAISFSNGDVTLINVSDNARVLSYNASSPRFATYGNTNQKRVQLYRVDNTAPDEVAKPRISPASGTFYSAQEVTITAGDGCTIYYTTDGGDPTASDAIYTAPFTITETTTVKAVAVKGNNMSEVAESVITIDTQSEWASSAENPLTVAKALALIQTLDAGKTGDIEVYVKGVVTEVSIDLSWGNATYKIADDAGDEDQLTVYRGFSFKGEKFSTTGDLNVDDEVVVIGKLQNYVKNEVYTPEVASGSKIYSINGNTEAPEVKLPEFNSLAELKAAASETKNVQLNLTECLVTFVSGQNLYLYDGQDGLLVFGSNSGFKAGDKISGTIKGQITLYNGLTELKNPDYSVQVVSSDNAIEPQSVTIGDIKLNPKNYESELVTIEDLTPQAAAFENKNLIFIDEDESELAVRDNFSVMTEATYNTAAAYTVTGFIAIYATATTESTVQLYPRTAEDIVNPNEEELQTPEAAWKPASVQVKVGESVTAVFSTNSDGVVSYESSNPDVATVDNQGNIAIVGAGSAKITATVEATNTFKSAVAVLEISVTSNDTDGSLANPYTIGDVQALYNPNQASGKVWVKGYIIGSANSTLKNLVTEGGESAIASNLILADASGESDVNNMIPVNLANNTAPRTALNLQDNADLIGKQVWVYGTIEKYFSVAGVKNVTNWSLDGVTEGNPSEVLPVITPATGTYEEAQEVTITVAEGYAIYYTLDGTDPTVETGTLYTAPFMVEETTTVKAIAAPVTGGNVSKVVTSVITISQGQQEGYTKIADIKADATADKVAVTYNAQDVLVTYINSKNLYVFDGTDGLLLFGTNSGIAVGDKISVTVKGNLYLYNGLTEIADVTYSDLIKVSEGNEVTAQEVEISELTQNFKAFENELVTIKDVKPAEEAWTKKNMTFTDDSDNEIVLRDNFSAATGVTFETSETYNITGFVAIYVKDEASTIQIYPRSENDIEKTSESELQVPEAAWTAERVQVTFGEAVEASFQTNSDGAVSYESSNTNVATVDEQGNIIVVGVGVANITATVAQTATFKAASAVLVVAVTSGADGSMANPYTVVDVQALCTDQASEKVWVKGYIIGCADGSFSENKLVKEGGEKAVKTNFVLAAAADEAAIANMIPVALPDGKVREALNLKDNADLLGKQIWLYGTIEKYFSVAGVKSVSDFSFDGATGIKGIDAENASDKVIYNLAGQRLQNLNKAGIYIVNGKKVAVK